MQVPIVNEKGGQIMEMTNYQRTGTYDYDAWLRYVNRDVLPQYLIVMVYHNTHIAWSQ